MRSDLRGSQTGFPPLILGGVCALTFLASLWAGPPQISLIELFLTDKVLIHFDTEADLSYELQVSKTLAANQFADGPWTNLYVAPKLPFPNHYVIVDTRTDGQRFYRLQVVR